jgi:hypothetical protein
LNRYFPVQPVHLEKRGSCCRAWLQGCQICLVGDTETKKMYQINTKYTKSTQNTPNQHKIHQMVIKFPKCPQNVPNAHYTFSMLRPSKIYQKLKIIHLATLLGWSCS